MAQWQRHITRVALAGAIVGAFSTTSFGTISRVSQDSGMSGWNFASGQVMGGSFAPISVSSDGRYVVFVTDAENIDSHREYTGSNVAVLHDTQTGNNTLVTPSYDGQPLNGGIDSVSVSSDGHYVAFTSWASNVVANDGNGAGDVFVRDVWLGTTARVSVTDSGAEAYGDSWSTARGISADGRYVAFVSQATNLVANDTNNSKDVFVRDTQTRHTYLISKSTGGVLSDSDSEEPCISSSGRYVTYFCFADNLVSGLTGQMPRVFLRDTDPAQNKTSLVAMGVLGSVSNDGRYVAYTSLPGGASPWGQVYVHDMTAGTDKPVSVAPDGVTLGNRDSMLAWINDSGRYVCYTSKARNLVANDTNDESDVFFRDLQTNTTTRLSVAVDGLQVNRASGYGYPSSDGRYVAFLSGAEDLVPLDFNEEPDVFITGPLFAASLKFSDAVSAAAIVGGKKAASTADMASYNVVKTAPGASRIDLADAVRIARVAAGLDPAP